MKPRLREIDHVVLMVRFYSEVLGAEFVAFRPQFNNMTHLRAGSSMIDLVAVGDGVSIYPTDPEGNQVQLKGPSDGRPPPS